MTTPGRGDDSRRWAGSALGGWSSGRPAWWHWGSPCLRPISAGDQRTTPGSRLGGPVPLQPMTFGTRSRMPHVAGRSPYSDVFFGKTTSDAMGTTSRSAWVVLFARAGVGFASSPRACPGGEGSDRADRGGDRMGRAAMAETPGVWSRSWPNRPERRSVGRAALGQFDLTIGPLRLADLCGVIVEGLGLDLPVFGWGLLGYVTPLIDRPCGSLVLLAALAFVGRTRSPDRRRICSGVAIRRDASGRIPRHCSRRMKVATARDQWSPVHRPLADSLPSPESARPDGSPVRPLPASGQPHVPNGDSPLLNVLQLIPTLDRSGAEKQMVLLAKGLPATGSASRSRP